MLIVTVKLRILKKFLDLDKFWDIQKYTVNIRIYAIQLYVRSPKNKFNIIMQFIYLCVK